MKYPLQPKELKKFLEKSKCFDGILKKINFLSLEKGKVLGELKLEEEHLNLLGGLHGGFSTTVVDLVGTFALLCHPKGKETDSVSVDIHSTFLKGAGKDETITIDARALRVGNTMAFLYVELRNKKGELMVQGSHTKYIFPKKKEKAAADPCKKK